MLRLKLLSICLLLLVFIGRAQENEMNSNADLDMLLEWFTGEFNNFEQHEEDVYAKEKEGKDIEPHVHMHSIFAPVELPGLGDYVFHIQQSDGKDLTKVFRQRIYVFEPNNNQNTISLKIYKYPKGNDYFDAHKNKDLYKDIDISELIETGCVVNWKRDKDRFIGTSKGGHCKIYSQYFQKEIIVKDSITLFKDQIWLLDDIFDNEGNLLMGRKDGIPRKLKKCKFYNGWAAIRIDEPNADSTAKAKYTGYYKLKLHNQGQRAELIDKDGNIANYEVSLAQLTYSNTNTAVLKLGVHNKGEKKTKLYIWGEPNAPRLGLNVKWIQTGFTLNKGQLFSE